MLSLLLLAAYALVCIAQIIYILRSKPVPATEQSQLEGDQATWWWLGYPL